MVIREAIYFMNKHFKLDGWVNLFWGVSVHSISKYNVWDKGQAVVVKSLYITYM